MSNHFETAHIGAGSAAGKAGIWEAGYAAGRTDARATDAACDRGDDLPDRTPNPHASRPHLFAPSPRAHLCTTCGWHEGHKSHDRSGVKCPRCGGPSTCLYDVCGSCERVLHWPASAEPGPVAVIEEFLRETFGELDSETNFPVEARHLARLLGAMP